MIKISNLLNNSILVKSNHETHPYIQIVLSNNPTRRYRTLQDRMNR
jgi:hypothetical protein